jgi:type IV pilus assembly protein PilN
MIKINLLPTKPVKKKARGEVSILVLLLVLLVEGVVAYLLYSSLSGKVEDQQRENEIKQGKIASIKEDIKDHEAIKNELSEIDAREKIIEELKAGRTGPVQVLMELSAILSQGGGPSVDKEAYKELLKRDPSAGYNPEWDSRRLWLTSFKEADRTVDMTGMAMSNEDVGEFLRRLKLSNYFFDEQLVKTSEAGSDKTSVPIVSWHIKSKIRYQ